MEASGAFPGEHDDIKCPQEETVTTLDVLTSPQQLPGPHSSQTRSKDSHHIK